GFQAGDAPGFLMGYLQETQKTNLGHMRLNHYEPGDFMALDEATLKNLELTANLREGTKGGSLLAVLDATETAMGGRMLRHFLTHPLVGREQICERLDAVEELVQERALLDRLREALKA